MTTYTIAPIIRYSLLSFYGSLMLPLLLVLAYQDQGSLAIALMGLGILLGGVVTWGSLSQTTVVDDAGIRILYPQWVPQILRRQWAIAWSDVVSLEASSTSQGGLAYYIQTLDGSLGLLPLRVGRLRQLLQEVQTYTGIDTGSVNPYVQPWMYLGVGILSLLMWVCDGLLVILALGALA